MNTCKYMCILSMQQMKRPLPNASMLAYLCNPPILCTPATSNQSLLQYLAISHPASYSLPYCKIQVPLSHISKGQQESAKGRHRAPSAAQLFCLGGPRMMLSKSF